MFSARLPVSGDHAGHAMTIHFLEEIMQFKSLAAAAALVLAAPAFAAITAPSGVPAGQANPGDNTELFLVVADSTAKVSFTYDLGVTLGSFIATEAAGPFNLSYNVGQDANWATFMSASTGTMAWAVIAFDNFGGTGARANRILTTVRDGSQNLVGNTTNTQLSAGIGGAQGGQFFGSINATGTHKTQPDGSSVNYETDNGFGYFGKAGGLTPNFNNNTPFVSTNALGTDSSLFLLSRSGVPAGNRVLVDQLDTGLPVVVSFDGSMLQISAVPEPGTYALMLAGLLAVGQLVRRRG